jgi:hypothetical protein
MIFRFFTNGFSRLFFRGPRRTRKKQVPHPEIVDIPLSSRYDACNPNHPLEEISMLYTAAFAFRSLAMDE